MASEMMVPFRVDGNGRVVTSDNPDFQVRLHVLALLNTRPIERAAVPGYGTDLVGLVFDDPDGQAVAAQASLRVKASMAAHEPGVTLVRAEVNSRATDNNIAAIDVEYARKDAADTQGVANANMAIIGANGRVRDVVRG